MAKIEMEGAETEINHADGLVIISASSKVNSQYELFSSDDYQKNVDNTGFDHISHKEYLGKYLNTKKFIDEYL